MSDDQHPQLELQISSSKALVRRMDQQLKLVERLLAEADAAQAVVPDTFTNSLGMAMLWCPPGEFLMGSPMSEYQRWDQENQVFVRINRGFWLAQTTVTQGQWHALMGNNPSRFTGSKELPVEQVSWDDAVEFCSKLNAHESLPSGYRYSLPTEAQWEYACRAGTTTPFHFGSTVNGTEANCDGTRPYGTEIIGPFLGQTSIVRNYPPNAWGLYDMHGNVWEWCTDWYENTRTSKNLLLGGIDPIGPVTGLSRMKRGGSWRSNVSSLRAARRYADSPRYRDNETGFRVAAIFNRKSVDQ